MQIIAIVKFTSYTWVMYVMYKDNIIFFGNNNLVFLNTNQILQFEDL